MTNYRYRVYRHHYVLSYECGWVHDNSVDLLQVHVLGKWGVYKENILNSLLYSNHLTV